MKDPLQSCLLLTQLEGEIGCLALVGREEYPSGPQAAQEEATMSSPGLSPRGPVHSSF